MRFEKIWIEQCRATRAIKRRFGVKDALDYLVGEKLRMCAGAARYDAALLQGEITRLNRKTATVCCNPSGHWRVSPSLLRPVTDALGSSPPAARVLPISADRRPR